MAARGAPKTTVNGWYRDRARTGHPEKAGWIGRTDYWYKDEWTAWYRARQQGKIDSLTRVDRTGDPDDLVDAAEAARILRYSSRDVIHANRRLGYFPEPDAHGTTSKGRPAPLWKRSTVWVAADSRRGMGGGHKPGTPGAPAKPHPYVGDERLARVLAGLRSGTQPSAAGLAAEWNVTQRTAERIVRAARTLLQEEQADLAAAGLSRLNRSGTSSRLCAGLSMGRGLAEVVSVKPPGGAAGQVLTVGLARRGAEGCGSLSLPRPARRVDGALARRSRWRACPLPIWHGRGSRCRGVWKHRRALLLFRAPCP